MKPRIRNQWRRAMTAFEVLVVIACLLVVATVLLSLSFPTHQRQPPRRVHCVSNLRQISLAFRIWEGDNGNLYPMAVSVTNGGGMELIQSGNLVSCLQVVSNEISTPKLLICPDDTGRTFARNWDSLKNSNISYFFNADLSNDVDPHRVFSGDDNLSIDGKPTASGLLALSSNAPVSWFGSRHGGSGNLSFADGSVMPERSINLQRAFQGSGFAKNRIVIP